MIVNHDKKFVFVGVAKAASTSIHRCLGYADDPTPDIYHMHLKDIIYCNPEAANYFKFGFVRNPYDRIVSAYNDFKNDLGHQAWAFPIQRHATFKHFAMNLHDSPCKQFIHIQPQYDFLDCGGDIAIDFVGKFESLQRDFNTVQKLLGLEVKKLEIHRANSHNHYESYYDEECRQAIYKFYKKDFEAFGYEK